MHEEEFRRRVAELEDRLRQEQPLTRSEQLFLLTAYLLLSRTRRDLNYGHP
jgi:hypothetical protein